VDSADPERTHRPFFSERCKLLDLGNWLGGEYRVAASADGAAPSPSDGSDA